MWAPRRGALGNKIVSFPGKPQIVISKQRHGCIQDTNRNFKSSTPALLQCTLCSKQSEKFKKSIAKIAFEVSKGVLFSKVLKVLKMQLKSSQHFSERKSWNSISKILRKTLLKQSHGCIWDRAPRASKYLKFVLRNLRLNQSHGCTGHRAQRASIAQQNVQVPKCWKKIFKRETKGVSARKLPTGLFVHFHAKINWNVANCRSVFMKLCYWPRQTQNVNLKVALDLWEHSRNCGSK